MRACHLLGLGSLLLGAAAAARPGDWFEPILVARTPFAHASASAGRPDGLRLTSCPGVTSVDGRELVYQVVVPTPSLLRVELSTQPDCRGQVAVLASLALDASDQPAHCLAAAPRSVEQEVATGDAWVVVEVAPADAACALHLRLDLEPLNAWYARPLAQGVSLHTWRGRDDDGLPRFVAVLDVDRSVPGVALRPLPAAGCARTSTLGQQAGAVAAINGGFFGGPRCRSVSLLQLDGVAHALNSRERSALGLAADGSLHVQRVPARQPWPEMRHALGGVPRLVRGGAVDVTWRQERARQDFAERPHPRSAVATTARGALLIAVDGRSEVGAGLALDELARLLVELGARDALNLDGGGSTTLWVAGEARGGIVNHPSDGFLSVDGGPGERPVANALGVFAPPRPGTLAWHSAPLRRRVAVGEVWGYEALAIAERGAVVELSLAAAPEAAHAQLTARGDGSARLELQPGPDTPPVLNLQLVARAPGHAPLAQDLVLDVVGKFAPRSVDATMQR